MGSQILLPRAERVDVTRNASPPAASGEAFAYGGWVLAPVLGGLGIGATVTAVTGAFLVRMLKHPRAHAPAPLRRRARIALNHFQGRVYELTRGRVGGRMGGQPVLLLTTIGRRSGAPRRTPVQYQRVDGDLMLVAAAGGAPKPPAWWLNLEADPRVRVQIASECHSATAETLSEADRALIWPLLCERNRYLPRVEARAGRELPVVRLHLG